MMTVSLDTLPLPLFKPLERGHVSIALLVHRWAIRLGSSGSIMYEPKGPCCICTYPHAAAILHGTDLSHAATFEKVAGAGEHKHPKCIVGVGKLNTNIPNIRRTILPRSNPLHGPVILV